MWRDLFTAANGLLLAAVIVGIVYYKKQKNPYNIVSMACYCIAILLGVYAYDMQTTELFDGFPYELDMHILSQYDRLLFLGFLCMILISLILYCVSKSEKQFPIKLRAGLTIVFGMGVLGIALVCKWVIMRPAPVGTLLFLGIADEYILPVYCFAWGYMLFAEAMYWEYSKKQRKDS